jgi:hypothetical protein
MLSQPQDFSILHDTLGHCAWVLRLQAAKLANVSKAVYDITGVVSMGLDVHRNECDMAVCTYLVSFLPLIRGDDCVNCLFIRSSQRKKS